MRLLGLALALMALAMTVSADESRTRLEYVRIVVSSTTTRNDVILPSVVLVVRTGKDCYELRAYHAVPMTIVPDGQRYLYTVCESRLMMQDACRYTLHVMSLDDLK
jgi:hypothetical protein